MAEPLPASQLDAASGTPAPADTATVEAAGSSPTPAATVPPSPQTDAGAVLDGGMTLEALIGLADAHHPRLTAAFQDVQTARGRTLQAGLYPNPVLYMQSPQAAGKDSQYNGYVTQDIVTAKKLKLDVAAMMREVQQTEFAWQQSRFAIITDIRRQFYSTLAAQNRVSTLNTLVQISKRSREVSEKLLLAGEGTRSDTLLFGIEVDRATVGLSNAETVYNVGRRQLAILVGVSELEIARLTGDLEAQLPEYDVQQLRFEVGNANAAANIARVEVDRLGVRLQRAIVEPVPNINILGGYQRQVRGTYQDQGLFQVGVVVPLWNQNQGNIFATEAQLMGARANVSRVELELANQAADALATFRAASQLVAKYEGEILPKARETFRISQQLYAQGQIDFLRLLQAQKTLLEAELARIDAQEQRWTAAAMIAGLRQDEQFP